jgi:uncharacterized protein YukE
MTKMVTRKNRNSLRGGGGCSGLSCSSNNAVNVSPQESVTFVQKNPLFSPSPSPSTPEPENSRNLKTMLEDQIKTIDEVSLPKFNELVEAYNNTQESLNNQIEQLAVMIKRIDNTTDKGKQEIEGLKQQMRVAHTKYIAYSTRKLKAYDIQQYYSDMRRKLQEAIDLEDDALVIDNNVNKLPFTNKTRNIKKANSRNKKNKVRKLVNNIGSLQSQAQHNLEGISRGGRRH